MAVGRLEAKETVYDPLEIVGKVLHQCVFLLQKGGVFFDVFFFPAPDWKTK